MAAPGCSRRSSPGSSNEAVESILSQAMDQIALEKIAALSTSQLPDAVLPTDLESRFRRLKSLPTRTPPAQEPRARTGMDERRAPNSPIPPEGRQRASPRTPFPSPPTAETALSEPRVGHVPSSPDSSPKGRQACCFALSPKRGSKRRKEIGKGRVRLNRKENYGDLRLDSDALAVLKEQRKKALEQQEKVSGEAEKLVESVKQASARMDFSAVDDFLGDEDRLV